MLNNLPAVQADEIIRVASASALPDVSTIPTNSVRVTDDTGYIYSIVNGAWQKTSHIDTVNGKTGAVVLTTTDVSEGSNLYHTDPRVLSAISAGATSKILYVAQDRGSDVFDGSIGKPFKTIQAAINAANLIAAYYAPVVIMVSPPIGTGYAENLTFSQQGVVLQSMGGTYRNNVLVTGNVTINLTGTSGGVNFIAASNDIYIHGISFSNGGSGNTITFTGTIYQRTWFSDCYVDCTGVGNSALVMTNTGINGVKSAINSRNTDWNNNTSTAATCVISAGRFLVVGPYTEIQNSNTSGLSMLISGASAAGPIVTLDKCDLQGQLSVTDNTAAVYLTFSGVTSGSAAAVSTPATPSTGFIYLGIVSLSTSATNSIIGSGVVVLALVAKSSTGGDVINTVTQSLINGFPQGAIMFGAGATQNPNTLITVKNGHITSQQTTAPTAVLQAAAGSTATFSLVRCTDTAGNITITPNGVGAVAGTQLIVTFNKSYASAPVILLSAANSNAPSVSAYVTASTTTFTISFAVGGVIGTAYSFTYHVIET